MIETIKVFLIIGIILLVIGVLNLIRIDGSVKRIVLCLISIVLGSFSLLFYTIKNNTMPIEYEIVEVQSLNNDDTKYRVTLKSGANSTILYLDSEEVKNFPQGETIELTNNQIKEYK